MQIKRKYIVDDRDRKTAVLLDIATFQQIEEILENYALANLMQSEEVNEKIFDLEQAKAYYNALEK